MAINVYLVDARSIWRSGVRRVLEEGQCCAVAGEAADHSQAVSDSRLKGCDVLVSSWPPVRWAEVPSLAHLRTLCLLREGAEAGAGLAALKAGAAGCLYDDVADEQLRQAVQFVHAGGCIVDPRVAPAVVQQIHGRGACLPLLSEPEAKVASCIAQGCTNRQIAHMTGLAERTVVTVISNLLQKLGVPTRSAVAAWWIRQGGTPHL